jgi:hypothetical protein
MKFKFSRQAQPSGATLTKFHLLSADAIVGIITVPNGAADDLEKHWLGGATQPQEAAAAAALATPARGNPMVSAMLAAAKRHPLNRAAVLRGC